MPTKQELQEKIDQLEQRQAILARVIWAVVVEFDERTGQIHLATTHPVDPQRLVNGLRAAADQVVLQLAAQPAADPQPGRNGKPARDREMEPQLAAET